ncbi:hypothetical protein C8J56DRAFT_880140 [Mycena floridula]|nr:hypothetical protein C8J56DRAFT_880140 [Mycena floridula]
MCSLFYDDLWEDKNHVFFLITNHITGTKIHYYRSVAPRCTTGSTGNWVNTAGRKSGRRFWKGATAFSAIQNIHLDQRREAARKYYQEMLKPRHERQRRQEWECQQLQYEASVCIVHPHIGTTTSDLEEDVSEWQAFAGGLDRAQLSQIVSAEEIEEHVDAGFTLRQRVQNLFSRSELPRDPGQLEAIYRRCLDLQADIDDEIHQLEQEESLNTNALCWTKLSQGALRLVTPGPLQPKACSESLVNVTRIKASCLAQGQTSDRALIRRKPVRSHSLLWVLVLRDASICLSLMPVRLSFGQRFQISTLTVAHFDEDTEVLAVTAIVVVADSRFVLVAHAGATIGGAGQTTGTYSTMPWVKNGVMPPFPIAIECSNATVAETLLHSLQPMADSYRLNPKVALVLRALEVSNKYHAACSLMNASTERFYVVLLGSRCGVYITRVSAVDSLNNSGEFRAARVMLTFEEALLCICTNGDLLLTCLTSSDMIDAAEDILAQRVLQQAISTITASPARSPPARSPGPSSMPAAKAVEMPPLDLPMMPKRYGVKAKANWSPPVQSSPTPLGSQPSVVNNYITLGPHFWSSPSAGSPKTPKREPDMDFAQHPASQKTPRREANMGLGPEFVPLMASPVSSLTSSSGGNLSLEELFDLDLGYWLNRYLDVHDWTELACHTMMSFMRVCQERHEFVGMMRRQGVHEEHAKFLWDLWQALPRATPSPSHV